MTEKENVPFALKSLDNGQPIVVSVSADVLHQHLSLGEISKLRVGDRISLVIAPNTDFRVFQVLFVGTVEDVYASKTNSVFNQISPAKNKYDECMECIKSLENEIVEIKERLVKLERQLSKK